VLNLALGYWFRAAENLSAKKKKYFTRLCIKQMGPSRIRQTNLAVLDKMCVLVNLYHSLLISTPEFRVAKVSNERWMKQCNILRTGI
jgi:hypothetical protein